MKFKALIFDLDGTAVITGRENLPSIKLINSVKSAKQFVTVSVATARRISSLKNIFKMLEIESPSIIMGGTTIINPLNNKILWQKKLELKTVVEIANISKKFPGEIIMGDGPFYDRSKDFQINNCSVIYLRNPSREIANEIMIQLKNIPNINCVYAISWVPGWTDIHITHKDATKKRGVEELIKLLNVKKEEVMVVGDSHNDFALFEAAGFRVAMGNAEPELKKIADFVTLDVSKNGLAEAIDKFILNSK